MCQINRKISQAKLELIRELNNDVLALGKSDITKTWVYDWVDSQKVKINKELKE